MRGSLRFEPSDRITVDIIGNYQKDTPTGTAFKSLRFRPTDPVTGAVLGGLGIRDGAALAPGAGFEGGKPLGLDRKVWGVTGLSRPSSTTLSRSTRSPPIANSTRSRSSTPTARRCPVHHRADDARGNQFSQELRLTWDNGGPVTAFVGANYFHENGSERTPAQFDERAMLAQIAGALNGGGLIPGRPASDPAPMSVIGNPLSDRPLLQGVAGAYGYAALPAPARTGTAIAANLKPVHQETTDQLRQDRLRSTCSATSRPSSRRSSSLAPACAGPTTTRPPAYRRRCRTAARSSAASSARCSQTEPTRRALLARCRIGAGRGEQPDVPRSSGAVVRADLPADAERTRRVDQTFSDDGFTWRGYARYAPKPDTSLYAIYARGRRPKVLTAAPPALPGIRRASSSPTRRRWTAWRSARKLHVLDRTLYLDGAIFYYKYNNFQTTEQVGTVFITTNAGKADSYGFEGQDAVQPDAGPALLRQLRLQPQPLPLGRLQRQPLPASPDHTFSAGRRSQPMSRAAESISRPPSHTSRRSSSTMTTIGPNCRQSPAARSWPTLYRMRYQDGFALVSARWATTSAATGSGSKASSRTSSTRPISRTRAIPATASAWRPSSPASRGPTECS